MWLVVAVVVLGIVLGCKDDNERECEKEFIGEGRCVGMYKSKWKGRNNVVVLYEVSVEN